MPNTFKLTVANLDGVLFSKEVESVYLFGEDGEFELLPYHYPLIAALVPSEINIAEHDPLLIRSGVVMFRENECMIVVQMEPGSVQLQSSW